MDLLSTSPIQRYLKLSDQDSHPIPNCVFCGFSHYFYLLEQFSFMFMDSEISDSGLRTLSVLALYLSQSVYSELIIGGSVRD